IQYGIQAVFHFLQGHPRMEAPALSRVLQHRSYTSAELLQGVVTGVKENVLSPRNSHDFKVVLKPGTESAPKGVAAFRYTGNARFVVLPGQFYCSADLFTVEEQSAVYTVRTIGSE